MNRRIATWAVAALTVFGLTACGGAPSAPPEAPSADPATSAPAPSVEPTTQAPPTTEAAPEPPAEQSLAEACLEPSAKMIEAQAELTAAYAALSATDGKDPQKTVDAMAALADYFGKLAESSSHPDVKKALTGIQEGYQKFSVLMGKLLIDKDLSAAAEVSTVMADLQKAWEDFTKLCSA